MRRLIYLAPLAALLMGCVPVFQSSPLYLAKEYQLLYQESTERWLYFFGGPQSVRLDGRQLQLTPGTGESSQAVPGSLLVNGQPLWREVLPAEHPLAETARTLFGTHLVVSSKARLDSSWLYENRWYQLTGPLAANSGMLADPVPKLPSFAQDNQSGQVVLNQILARRSSRPVIIFVLHKPPLPAVDLSPAPTQYTDTALEVQYGLNRKMASLPVPSQLSWTVLRAGVQSGYSERIPMAYLATSPAAIKQVWKLATGNQLPIPPLPNLRGGAFAAFFWGLKPSGGYAVRMVSAHLANNTLTVRVQLTSPSPGTIVTQALTSPYLLLRGGGSPERVVFVDTQGTILAATSRR